MSPDARGAEARRLDTRQKIELGGLVVKAGLRHADRAFLLGLLMHAAQLDPASPEYQRLKTLGQYAFRQSA